jgi:hypothetical protein
MNDKIISNDIIFDCKADAVPFNYRISYKVSLICLVIGKCCGKKGCSEIKLQMINAAVCTKKSRIELFDLIAGSLITGMTLIRFDPAISRAINYALVDNLIYRQANGLLRLADRGNELVSKIYKDPELMIVEKDFFRELSNRLTEDIIESISHNWRVENA